MMLKARRLRPHKRARKIGGNAGGVYVAIADPTRRELLSLLRDEERSVNTLAGHFCVSRPAISKHLRVLREADLVRERRVGREHRYRINPEPLAEVRDWLGYFDRFWDEKLQALKTYVEDKQVG
jgi:DNA-binding transcriptional ArsR family regulator